MFQYEVVLYLVFLCAKIQNLFLSCKEKGKKNYFFLTCKILHIFLITVSTFLCSFSSVCANMQKIYIFIWKFAYFFIILPIITITNKMVLT